MKKRERIVMFFKSEWIHAIICFSLVALIWIVYGEINNYMKSVWKSPNEFVSTIECAHIIDQYGTEKSYVVEFELRTEIPGEVAVYFQNGNSKYLFYETIDSSTKFQKYRLEVSPRLIDADMDSSILCFYGTYGTGVKPIIKNISFQCK